MEESYTVKEIAKILKIKNEETVRGWIRKGMLKATKDSRKSEFIISEKDLTEFCNKTKPVYKLNLAAYKYNRELLYRIF